MKRNQMLTITSLLSILLLSLHLTQDAVRSKPGTFDAGPGNLIAILILLVYLCGTLLLAGRRSGFVIMLLGAFFSAAMPVLHLTGKNFTSARPGAFLFMWVLMAIGVTGAFSFLLSAHGIWKPRQDS